MGNNGNGNGNGANGLASKAMFVEFHASFPQGKKQDKAGAKAAADAVGAEESRYRALRIVLRDEDIAPMSGPANQFRQEFYRMTLRFGDRYIIWSEKLKDLLRKGREYRDLFEDGAADFRASYDQIIQRAKLELGSAFRPGDYPEVGRLRFRFALVPSPLVMSEDLARISGLSDEERDEIWRMARASAEDAQREFVSQVVERMAKVLVDLGQQMRADLENKEGKSGCWRGSKLTNLVEVADAVEGFLPLLKADDAKALRELSDQMRKLGSVDMRAVKDDMEQTEEVLDETTGLLLELGQFTGVSYEDAVFGTE